MRRVPNKYIWSTRRSTTPPATPPRTHPKCVPEILPFQATKAPSIRTSQCWTSFNKTKTSLTPTKSASRSLKDHLSSSSNKKDHISSSSNKKDYLSSSSRKKGHISSNSNKKDYLSSSNSSSSRKMTTQTSTSPLPDKTKFLKTYIRLQLTEAPGRLQSKPHKITVMTASGNESGANPVPQSYNNHKSGWEPRLLLPPKGTRLTRKARISTYNTQTTLHPMQTAMKLLKTKKHKVITISAKNDKKNHQ